jgi:hypothetical protein
MALLQPQRGTLASGAAARCRPAPLRTHSTLTRRPAPTIPVVGTSCVLPPARTSFLDDPIAARPPVNPSPELYNEGAQWAVRFTARGTTQEPMHEHEPPTGKLKSLGVTWAELGLHGLQVLAGGHTHPMARACHGPPARAADWVGSRGQQTAAALS